MAELGYPIAVFRLNGNVVPPPKEWSDLRVEAAFGDQIQPRITLDTMTFVNEAAGVIADWGGRGKYFEGLPFTINLDDGTTDTTVFSGYLNMAEGLVRTTSNTYKASAVELRGLQDIDRKLKSITFGYLESIGAVTSADYRDVPYLVVKESGGFELAVLSLATFIITKEVANTVYRIGKTAGDLVAHLTGGITGSIASAIFIGIVLVLEIAYAIALISALLKLGEELINRVIPIKRNHKAVTMQSALNSIFRYFGYTFQSNIDFSKFVYVPSKPEGTDFFQRRSQLGIPNPGDYGYSCAEMVELAKMLTNGRLYVTGTTVYLYADGDPFWRQTSGYIMPSFFPQREPVTYNTDEINSTEIISFSTDSTDFWTVENFTGTNYEIITQNKDFVPVDYNLLKGLKETKIPVALGNRKDTLTNIEKAAAELGFAIDSLVAIFGKRSRIGASVRNRRGYLKVGTKHHIVPKLVYMEGDFLPANHRDMLSARALWHNYYKYNSFVNSRGNGDYGGQKRKYRGVRIGMSYVDFLQAIRSRYFTLSSGETAEWLSLRWGFDSDTAECDFDVREIYTRELTETTIEP